MTAYPPVTGPSAKEDPVLAQLLEQLRERHNDAICGVLVYGSCLRSGNIYDGLLDLYLICDNYSAAYGNGFLAGANWLLPPNVFYAETSIAEQTLRAKVTVISLRDFQRGCSRAWFESYIWGRFAQPTHLLYYRDPGTRKQIENALLNAALTSAAGATRTAARGQRHRPVGTGARSKLCNGAAHRAQWSRRRTRHVLRGIL